jgi:hypothetical protein
MLPIEIFAAHFKRYEEDSDGVLGKNTKEFNVTLGGTHSNHHVSKGKRQVSYTFKNLAKTANCR